jgi:hypothetical protein
VRGERVAPNRSGPCQKVRLSLSIAVVLFVMMKRNNYVYTIKDLLT